MECGSQPPVSRDLEPLVEALLLKHDPHRGRPWKPTRLHVDKTSHAVIGQAAVGSSGMVGRVKAIAATVF